MRTFGIVGIIGLACWVACPWAVGQERADGEPPVLSGPEVESPQAEEPAQAFMPDEQRLAQRRAAEARALPRLLRHMAGPRTEASIRLRPAQQREIASIRRRYEASLAEYVEQNRAEIVADLGTLGAERAALRLESGEKLAGEELVEMLQRVARETIARASDGEPTDRRAIFRALGERQREALLRLVQVHRAAPQAEGVLDELLAVLDEPQRRYIEQQFARLHAAQMREAGEQEMAQEMRDLRMREKLGEMDQATADGPDRLDRLIAELTPAEREILADFIERRLLERLRQRGADKPAPSMDEVELPPAWGDGG